MSVTTVPTEISSAMDLMVYTHDTGAGSVTDITDMDVPFHIVMAYTLPHVVISLITKIFEENPNTLAVDAATEVRHTINEMCYINPDDDMWDSTKMGKLTQCVGAEIFMYVSSHGWQSGESDSEILYATVRKVFAELGTDGLAELIRDVNGGAYDDEEPDYNVL